jgi:1-pyrroline-5-carboxylate dehydrogenase
MSIVQPYHPTALTDFSLPANRDSFQRALDVVRSQLGQRYPLHLGARIVTSGATFDSVNPARPKQIVGSVVEGSADDARQALAAATDAFATWQHVDAETRARIILRSAAEIRRRKHEFSAWMVFEVGKSWAEADADTAETIDFLDFYARQVLKLARASETLTQLPGEDNQLQYIPLGPGAVIPPWNFPCAIAAGMTAAALVTGNTVVLKPSPLTPVIAYKICEVLWRNGVPAGALSYVPGPALEVGETLVDDPRTRFIAFTGSKAVGVRIYERAAKVHPGQKWLKRAILEMGGKDAVLVDETADLEAAADGIVASAFGFQGQKCSAGSRAIIVNAVYDTVVGKVVEKASRLTQGPTDHGPDIHQGPVSDLRFFEKIMGYIETGTQEGKLLLGGKPFPTPDAGWFIEPTIFGDVPGDARIAQEEIFGPVLACIRAGDFDDALRIANSTEYGLTGAVYSTDRQRLERARREYHVGNLYLNRKCTGALVGVHPFGGFNMSGTDSKAGGPDYLLLFTQAKSVAEQL